MTSGQRAVVSGLIFFVSTVIAVAGAPDPAVWSPKAAAGYLDARAAWWQSWPNAARDHGTFCVSCHTAAPYALARAALRKPLAESGPSAPEAALAENVARRVAMWNEVAPYYPDQTRGIPKTSESRGTEAVLNALVLSMRDAAAGRIGSDTRQAFARMWELQMRTDAIDGAWAWLNFHYEPWESSGAPYFGASLAALAVGSAPDGYAGSPEIADNLGRLRKYFQREFDRQSLFNRLMALWASSRLDGLLTPVQRTAAIDGALQAQQPDGGWSLASLGSWKRIDGSAVDTGSDGYATGLAVLALRSAGTPASDARIARGVEWLNQHQDRSTGQWSASSLNKTRDPASDVGKFMSDAATAYAVLALTQK